ncbi:MAG: DUF6268 family outer membrane beta-barrel protein [Burkholderiales bacterium]
MPAPLRFLGPVLALASLAVATTGAQAQRLPVGATVASASLTGFAQLDAGIDGGGDVKGSGAYAIGSVVRQFTPELSAGLTLRYDYEHWTFSGENAFGGAPFGSIHRPSVGASLVYATDAGIAFTALPTVQWAYASGASTADALNWGAILAVSRTFSKDLTLGIGAGVYREIDKTEAFPVLLVDWRIDERWRVSNPVPAGPAGGAGLEVAYTIDDRWELAAGGAWRRYRFRLDENGATPDGIAERQSIPLLARATWRPTPASRLDLYAGVALAGEITLYDRNGQKLVSRDIDPAALFGITLQSRF